MKAFFSVLALAVLLSSLAYSQSGQSQTNTAQFTVTQAITVTAIPGDFGELLAGTTYTITPDGSIAPDNGFGSVLPIEWDIVGQPDASVLISFGLPSFFSSPGSAHVPYSVGAQSAGWAPSFIAPNTPYNPIDPRVPNTITLIGGAATVQLGGVLAVPSSANGVYSAQFVLTASYTGL
jgi:hypothetical protein